jgi:hypothetical protein
MAKADDKIPVWMPFAEALARAGSLEALLPVLIAGDAMARATDFLVNGHSIRRADRTIPPEWWDSENAHDVDPAAGRAKFLIDGFIAMTAIGIEIEAAPISARRPVVVDAAQPTTTKRHAGGRDPDHDWEGAARHVDACVKKKGPLPRHPDGKPAVVHAVRLMVEWFEKYDSGAPTPDSIRRWIRNNPRPWW